MRVNVLYNIKITIFAAEIKSVFSVGGNGFLSILQKEKLSLDYMLLGKLLVEYMELIESVEML